MDVWISYDELYITAQTISEKNNTQFITNSTDLTNVSITSC